MGKSKLIRPLDVKVGLLYDSYEIWHGLSIGILALENIIQDKEGQSGYCVFWRQGKRRIFTYRKNRWNRHKARLTLVGEMKIDE
jgi:hypothetical protein